MAKKDWDKKAKTLRRNPGNVIAATINHEIDKLLS